MDSATLAPNSRDQWMNGRILPLIMLWKWVSRSSTISQVMRSNCIYLMVLKENILESQIIMKSRDRWNCGSKKVQPRGSWSPILMWESLLCPLSTACHVDSGNMSRNPSSIWFGGLASWNIPLAQLYAAERNLSRKSPRRGYSHECSFWCNLWPFGWHSRRCLHTPRSLKRWWSCWVIHSHEILKDVTERIRRIASWSSGLEPVFAWDLIRSAVVLAVHRDIIQSAILQSTQISWSYLDGPDRVT